MRNSRMRLSNMNNSRVRKRCNKISNRMKRAEASVVVLSDTDSESDDDQTITLVESDTTAPVPEVEVITLDDSSVSNKSNVSFKIDLTPGQGLDFIPVPKYSLPRNKILKRKRLLSSPDITVLKVRQNCSPRRLPRVRFRRSRKKTKVDDDCPRPVVAAESNNARESTRNDARTENDAQRVASGEPSRVQCSGQNNAVRGKTTEPVANEPSSEKRCARNGVRSDFKPAENDLRKPRIPEIHLSHSNILNTVKTSAVEGLRPIIIDGCNVGFGYGNGEFSIQGVIYVVQYFQKRGHEEIVCFLPTIYRNKLKALPVHPQIRQYEKENIIIYTPSRYVNRKLIKPYDDRFIVQYASERGGVIISNDGYQDLMNEEASWRTTIENRLVNFTFARGLFMLPKDPLGPEGPTLDEILRFP